MLTTTFQQFIHDLRTRTRLGAHSKAEKKTCKVSENGCSKKMARLAPTGKKETIKKWSFHRIDLQTIKKKLKPVFHTPKFLYHTLCLFVHSRCVSWYSPWYLLLSFLINPMPESTWKSPNKKCYCLCNLIISWCIMQN